ncbi:hypothetical protein BVY02_00325 [bacterium J17]|nr:hypothetical protein BVY02_00325 [bacterium J17]
MRIGIYLGRHAGAGGGIAVYSRSLLLDMLEIVGERSHEEDELVFYVDSAFLTEDVKRVFQLSEVLTCFSQESFGFGAGQYFKPLPNGARARVLIRVLPKALGHRSGILLDQLFLPIFAKIDRLDLLHSSANLAAVASSCPQVVTVHDLYQGWPVGLEGEGRGKISRIVRLLYRRMFKAQFKKIEHTITDARFLAEEIYRRFSFDKAKITTIPLGLDAVFSEFKQSLQNESSGEKLSAQELLELCPSVNEEIGEKIESGFVLFFASLDPRKNLERSLRAWVNLDQTQQGASLLIVTSSKRVRKACKQILSASGFAFAKEQGAKEQGVSVVFVDWLPRTEMPPLISAAEVLLVPTLAEGFGLPAFEAISLGTKVVTGKVEIVADLSSSLSYFCKPESEADISRALKSALNDEVLSSSVSPGQTSKNRVALLERTMRDAARETYLIYQKLALRVG